MKKQDKEDLHRRIRKKYADIVKAGANTCGWSSSCCNPQASSLKDLSNKLGYSSEELNSVPVDQIWDWAVEILRQLPCLKRAKQC